jgi:hypothetical protein
MQAKEDGIVSSFKWFDGDFVGYGVLTGVDFNDHLPSLVWRILLWTMC